MSESYEAAMPIDINRLRVALRLCFDTKQADAIASFVRRDTADPVDVLTPVVRAARLSYGLRRLVAPLVRRHGDAPLWPRLNLDTDAALMLALHVALDCDSALLARLFARSTEDAGANLQRARQVIAAERVEPCVAYRSLLGRYRELGPEREAQIALLQHVAQCPDCRRALELARQTDAGLRETAEALAGALPPVDTKLRRSARLVAHPMILRVGAILIALLLLTGALLGVTRYVRPSHHATPLMAPSPNTRPTGWLLEADETGNVDAVDLRSGARRLLIPGVSGTRVDDLISPDHRTIAQTIYLQYPKQPESLRIYDLDGTLRQRWDLETAQFVRTPLTWIDNSRLLMTQIPVAAFEPTLNVFTHNVRQGSSLIVLNVDSGAEHSIATEGVHLARSSPDGTLLAIERYSDDATGRLEIHAFDGQTLGPVVAAFADQPGSFWWSPDGQSLFAVVRQADSRFGIVVIGRSGQARTLVEFDERDVVNLLGVAPDGQTLVYTDASGSGDSSPWAYWQVDPGSGRVRKLADGKPGQLSVAQAAWSPQGESLVLVSAEPYYLTASDPATRPISYVTLAFDRQGNALGAVLDGLRASTLLGWFPDSGVPASLPAQSAPSGQSGASNVIAGANLTIDAFSRISPDRSRVLLRDQTRLNYVAHPLNGDAPETLGFMNDPSWLPDGAGIIGDTAGAGPSRLTLTGDPSGVLRIDPATLGSMNGAYRLPLIAPNGLRFSFFVIRGNTVQLWVGGRNQPAGTVASWIVPGDVKTEPPLVAKWDGNEDLIFLTPDDWHAGLPQRSELRRWSAGHGAVDTMLGWSIRGNELGIQGQELELALDGSQVAIRLRHFTGANVEKDRTDSIVVAASRDVSQAFEIARDASGDGLSWSPDGTELAAGLRDKIAVLAADGRTVEYPPVGDAAAYPLWLQPDEIWFSTNDGSGQTIRRLRR